MGAAIPAAITAGGQLIGSGIESAGQAGENARTASGLAHQGRTLADLVSSQILGQGVDLTGQANRALTQGSHALDATLASQGLFNSGARIDRQSQLTSDVLSGLAQARNQDQFNRAQLAGNIFQNESFQFYDPGAQNAGQRLTPEQQRQNEIFSRIPGMGHRVQQPGGFINQGGGK